MSFENTAHFVKWLDEIINTDYDLSAVLDDVEYQYSTTGALHYEASPYLTISGNPELYYFDVIETYDDWNESWDTVIYF